MNILGIESTCDETSVAIVADGKKILAHLISSQAKVHSIYGGVFPEIASRYHIDRLLPLVECAMKESGLTKEEIDQIAVAEGPGLMGSLLMGITAAKTLAFAWDKPLVGVNHVKAHLYAAMMGNNTPLLFPALGVVLSGGHTFLAKVSSVTSYEIIGTTVDDAIGEAFDKVASLLSLPYPGGPEIEKLAKEGDPNRFSFKAGQIKKRPLDFSFSGIKTNVSYMLQQNPSLLNPQGKKDIAASFQKAAFVDVLKKALKAAKTFPCRAIYMGGGVTCNEELKRLFNECPFPLFTPPKELSLDNGAMIAGYAFYLKERDLHSITPFPRISSENFSCSE